MTTSTQRKIHIVLFHGDIISTISCTHPNGLNIEKVRENSAIGLQIQALEAGVELDLNNIVEAIEVLPVEDMKILQGYGDVYMHEYDEFVPVKVSKTVYVIDGHEDVNYYRVYSNNKFVEINKEWGCHLSNGCGDYLTITHPCE